MSDLGGERMALTDDEAVAINAAVADDLARLGMELAIYNCRQEGIKADRETALLDEVDRIRRERGIPPMPA